MSIEALIQAHTEALLANTEAVKLLTVSLTGRTPKAEEKPLKVEKTIKEIVEKKPHPKVEESDTASDADANADTEVEAVPYETLRTLVLKLASGGKREEIKAVNGKHGLSNAKELLSNPEDMSSVKDQDKLNAYYADLQALEG